MLQRFSFMNIFIQLSLSKSLLTSSKRYQFLIMILFRRLQSTHSRIIPFAFSIKKIGMLAGDLLGLIQPFLKVLSRYSCKICNSFYKKLQMGTYSGVLFFFKLIIWSYLEFYSSILASSLKKTLISSLYISSRLEPMEVKATIAWQCASGSQ